MASSRNAVSVFDPELARKQTQAELRANAAPKKIHEVNKIGGKPPEISDEARKKMMDALSKEAENAQAEAEMLADAAKEAAPGASVTDTSSTKLVVMSKKRFVDDGGDARKKANGLARSPGSSKKGRARVVIARRLA